jgi:signal transduction histidine kinase
VPYEKTAVRALARVAVEISAAIQRIDRDRLLEVRARIDGKVVQQIPSKDLFYQILDGLRSLTGYDHSSAVLIYEDEPDQLRVAAEQIAWFKGKSRRIGRVLALGEPEMKLLRTEAVYGFDRVEGHWRDWPGQSAEPLARLLGYHDGDPGAEGEGGGQEGSGDAGSGEAESGPPPRPRRPGPERRAGAAGRSGDSGPHRARRDDALRHAHDPRGTDRAPEGVGRQRGDVRPLRGGSRAALHGIATVAIQNSQKTETLQARMLEAVRKHAIVDLARGVSHDINNALGAVLPLVQQMQEDVRSGKVDPAVHEKDLQQIEQSLQICRRIFGGMLSFARGSARNAGEGDARRAVEGTLDVLSDTLERRGVHVVLEVPDGLPFVKGGQGDLEQLFLNLITNARDAMEAGGTLTVRARRLGHTIEIVIEDTGIGIPPDRMAKIHEPFFTTKPHGTGLGLSTCRWIIWEMRGEMKIDSEPGRGTRVTIALPVIEPSAPGAGPGRHAPPRRE